MWGTFPQWRVELGGYTIVRFAYSCWMAIGYDGKPAGNPTAMNTCIGEAVMDTILDYGHDTVEQQRFLEKHRLVRLKLGWELKALSLDGARLRTNDAAARAEAKAAAEAYRQCIADLTSVVGGALG